MTAVPPVTVLAIPVGAGSRGYGGRVDASKGILYIAYNPAIEKYFTDIKGIKRMVMLREHFNALPLNGDFYDDIITVPITAPLPKPLAPVIDSDHAQQGFISRIITWLKSLFR